MPFNHSSNANKSKAQYRPLETSSLYPTCDSCTSSGGSSQSLSSDDSLAAFVTTTATSSSSSSNTKTGTATHQPYRLRRHHHHSWTKSASMRKLIAAGVLISMLFCYLTWASLAATDKQTTSYDQSYQGKSNLHTLQRQRQRQRKRQRDDQSPIAYNNATTTLHDGASPKDTANLFHQIARISSAQLMAAMKDMADQLDSPKQSVGKATGSNLLLETKRKKTITKQAPNGFTTDKANESLNVCTELFTDSRQYIANRPRGDYDQLPMIYFVTPTYARQEQVAELTRLAHTLMHVPRLHWIVANDFGHCNAYLDYLLTKFGIPFTLLASPMPDSYRKKKPMPRGVANRRAALNWLRSRNITAGGVLYFGDDDNTYDLRLFSEIRDTQRVSMFPVSLIGHSVSSPVVRAGKVVGFLDEWVAERHWPVDMAGFAVNLAYMAEHPNAGMPYKPGYEEDFFLRSIGLRLDLIEPKGNNCTEILVWHTQTKNHVRSAVRIGHDYLDDRSNLGGLFRLLEKMGVVTASDTDGAKAIVSKNGKMKPLSFFFS